MHVVRPILVINHNQYRPLIPKLILVRILLRYPPRQPRIRGYKRITLIIWLQAVSDGSDGHDEPGSGGGEDFAVVVGLGYGPEV